MPFETLDSLRAIIKMLKICGLALYDEKAASTRYRLSQYIDGLRAEGIELKVFPLLGDSYIHTKFSGGKYRHSFLLRDYMKRVAQLIGNNEYDLYIVHVELLPYIPSWLETRLLRNPYIYDMDDAFFLRYKNVKNPIMRLLLANKFDSVVREAAAVIAGNEYLAKYAQTWNKNTYVVPTVVDTQRYKCARYRSDNVFTVGWIGSPSTSIYLRLLRVPLARFAREVQCRFLVVGGHADPIEGVEVINLPWREDNEVKIINTFDVGVMPLFDDPWARGKCAFKLIQYMACCVPVIASRVGANEDVVKGGCGILASNDDDWYEALRSVYADARSRSEMGQFGRKKVVESYSLASALPKIVAIIRGTTEK